MIDQRVFVSGGTLGPCCQLQQWRQVRYHSCTSDLISRTHISHRSKARRDRPLQPLPAERLELAMDDARGTPAEPSSPIPLGKVVQRRKKGAPKGVRVRAGSDPNLSIGELPRIASIPPPLPRGASKDQLFLAALRSGITEGDLLDVELYAYTRRTSSAVDMPRPVYANEAALKHASEYFVTSRSLHVPPSSLLELTGL